ncbi:MAG: hypothetical protein K9M03_04410 [Kiritimatiellales bacterium]|nr:hypothetical protein [Kiritimatiellales bacterium]
MSSVNQIDSFAPPSVEENSTHHDVAVRIQHLRDTLGDDAGRYSSDELSQIAQNRSVYDQMVDPR